jgi:hypothetical protein
MQAARKYLMAYKNLEQTVTKEESRSSKSMTQVRTFVMFSLVIIELLFRF